MSDCSNVTSDLITEALASYTERKGVHARAAMAIARDQAKYERLGVKPGMIRQMFKEAQLSADERRDAYADELRYRRATSLWDAETEDDFDRAMQAAAEVQPGSLTAKEKLDGARAYSDGYLSVMKNGETEADNPCDHGTFAFVRWMEGAIDAAKEKAGQENGSLAVADDDPEFAEPEPAPAPPAPKRRGRPRKVQAVNGASQDHDDAPAPGMNLLDDFEPPAVPH